MTTGPSWKTDPLVEAITTWDFRDGAWLNAPSGFLRKDCSRKPSYHMLKKLIKEEWWTDETVRTDENGWAQAEGFKGDYRISCEGRSAYVKLLDDTQMSVAVTDPCHSSEDDA